MNWISIKEYGLPEYPDRYWVTIINDLNKRELLSLYYFPQNDFNCEQNERWGHWTYDENGDDQCEYKIIAYMDEIIPLLYQGE